MLAITSTCLRAALRLAASAGFNCGTRAAATMISGMLSRLRPAPTTVHGANQSVGATSLSAGLATSPLTARDVTQSQNIKSAAGVRRDGSVSIKMGVPAADSRKRSGDAPPPKPHSGTIVSLLSNFTTRQAMLAIITACVASVVFSGLGGTAIAAPKRDFSTFSALSDITNTAAGSITNFFQPLGTAKDPTSRCQAHNHMAQTALDAAGRVTRPGYVAPVPYLFENAALTGAWVRRDVHQEQFGNNTAPNTYYSFKPDDPVYGVFSEWRYPCDGTGVYKNGGAGPYQTLRNKTPAVVVWIGYRPTRRSSFLGHHMAVALLCGVPNNSGLNTPVAINALVVDHVNANKLDFRAANLQYITIKQNSVKNNRDDTGAVVVHALREFPDNTANGAWVDYDLHCLNSGTHYKWYRSFKADDETYRPWAGIAYPADGSAALRLGGTIPGTYTFAYKGEYLYTLHKPTMQRLTHHTAVALLYGVPNNSGLNFHNVLNTLTVDHIVANKLDYSAANLQYMTITQNAAKSGA
jgi:hypothetical protein